jgi:hypothetical protein
MEYISLNTLRNAYPSTQNYKKKNVDTVQLVGNFPQNFIDFKLPDLGSVEVVEDTSFKFIIQLKADEDAEDYIGLYTSPIFYNELLASLDENNPYSIQGPFFQENIITFFINDITPIYSKLIDDEIKSGVDVERNIFFLNNGDYNFEELVKYINWTVSSPDILTDINSSVLPVHELSKYTFKTYDTDLQIFENIENSLNDIKINDLTTQLNEFNISISDFEDFIANPGKIKLLPDSRIAKSIGLAGVSALNAASGAILASITLGATLGSSIGPIGTIIGVAAGGLIGIGRTLIKARKNKSNKERELEQVVNKIKAELIQLKERRDSISNEISVLQN